MKMGKMENTELYKSLLEVQKSIHESPEILSKGAKGYNYYYANLEAVLDFVKPHLIKNGLLLTFGGDNGEFRSDKSTAAVSTLIIHAETGQWMECMMTIPLNKTVRTKSKALRDENDKFIRDDKGKPVMEDFVIFEEYTPQDYGAAVSYARRYGVLSILGLVAEDKDAKLNLKDNDDIQNDSNVAPTTQDKPEQSEPVKPTPEEKKPSDVPKSTPDVIRQSDTEKPKATPRRTATATPAGIESYSEEQYAPEESKAPDQGTELKMPTAEPTAEESKTAAPKPPRRRND